MLSHRLDWRKLPQIIASSLNEQVKYLYGIDRKVDIVRTSVFTSMRDDTKQESYRNKMVTDFYSSNFDVHQFVTSGHAEKCVDISLAVEMLFMATVPNAYDIAVIVTGDKDFMPALRKTREKGKRVAICSMRNSCNKQLVRPDSGIRDFELIWIEDSLEDIIVPFEAG